MALLTGGRRTTAQFLNFLPLSVSLFSSNAAAAEGRMGARIGPEAEGELLLTETDALSM